MQTRTVIYRDITYDHLAEAISRMTDHAAWNVRHTEILEPVSTVTIEATPNEGAHIQKILTILVVYERIDA